MPFGECIPEARITPSSGNVEIVQDNWYFRKSTQGHAGDHAEGSTATSSQSPEEVFILIGVCSDELALRQNFSLNVIKKKSVQYFS